MLLLETRSEHAVRRCRGCPASSSGLFVPAWSPLRPPWSTHGSLGVLPGPPVATCRASLRSCGFSPRNGFVSLHLPGLKSRLCQRGPKQEGIGAGSPQRALRVLCCRKTFPSRWLSADRAASSRAGAAACPTNPPLPLPWVPALGAAGWLRGAAARGCASSVCYITHLLQLFSPCWVPSLPDFRPRGCAGLVFEVRWRAGDDLGSGATWKSHLVLTALPRGGQPGGTNGLSLRYFRTCG